MARTKGGRKSPRESGAMMRLKLLWRREVSRKGGFCERFMKVYKQKNLVKVKRRLI